MPFKFFRRFALILLLHRCSEVSLARNSCLAAVKPRFLSIMSDTDAGSSQSNELAPQNSALATSSSDNDVQNETEKDKSKNQVLEDEKTEATACHSQSETQEMEDAEEKCNDPQDEEKAGAVSNSERATPAKVPKLSPNSTTKDDVIMIEDEDEAQETDEIAEVNAKDLAEFGYVFNNEGQLRDKDSGSAFVFDKYNGNHKKNQRRYELLGEMITEHVYSLLEAEELARTHFPRDAKEKEPTSFIFHTEDLFQADKLMILIHGNGVVRAGQWARRLIINDCLDSGTQLPYIRQAKALEYAVLVLNTNLNTAVVGEQEVPIRNNRNPEEHAMNVWQWIVEKCSAKHVAVVAHSYGGVVTTEMAINQASFAGRVFAVAFTDSVHDFDLQNASPDVIKFFKEKAKNWVTSEQGLDTPVESPRMPGLPVRDDCTRVSAGTQKHEETSHCAMSSVFNFFAEKLREIQVREEEVN